MQEFLELVVLSDHACLEPRAERMEVYEPIAMESLFVTIFRCCSQVFSEPSARVATPPGLRTLPACGVEAAA